MKILLYIIPSMIALAVAVVILIKRRGDIES
jgi:preprotein translocase subunit SecG